MSQSARTVPDVAAVESLWAAWATLAKARITGMVGFAAFIGGLLGQGRGADMARVAEAALWIALVSAASCMFNQLLERDVDARMERTQRRPLVTGRVRPRDVVFVAAGLALVGVLALALRFNTLSALLALATLAAYALVYTPLKRLSTLNTAVGAIPGAMPPLIGFVAAAGAPGAWAWHLFAVLFMWQFPHFLAIAWLYRHDYARAGLKMLPAVEGSEGMAGRQALLYSLALVPVSLLPVLRGDAGPLYATAALVLGAGYCAAAMGFALKQNAPRARVLLYTSLAYLPALFSLVLMDPIVRSIGARMTP